jgi:hypothetical protein
MVEINCRNPEEGGSEITGLHSKFSKGSQSRTSESLLETMTVVQLVTKFLYFYGI